MLLVVYSIAIAVGLLMWQYPRVLLFQFMIAVTIGITNYDNADYMNYKSTYDAIGTGTLEDMYFQLYEPGYRFLAEISTKFELNYHEFRSLILITGNALIYYALKGLKRAPFIFSLYLVFQFLLDIVQIRNFIGFSIFFYAYSKFIQSDSWETRAFLKVQGLILLASLFQYVYIIYFIVNIICLIWMKSKKQTTLLILIMNIISLNYIIFGGADINSFKYIDYFETRTSTVTITLLSIIMSVLFLIYKRTIDHDRSGNFFKPQIMTGKAIFLVCLICLPMLFLNVEFFRLIRNLIPVMLVGVSLSRKKITIVWTYYLVCSVILACFFNIYAGWDTVFSPIFLNY
jgi:hypothetical protein